MIFNLNKSSESAELIFIGEDEQKAIGQTDCYRTKTCETKSVTPRARESVEQNRSFSGTIH